MRYQTRVIFLLASLCQNQPYLFTSTLGEWVNRATSLCVSVVILCVPKSRGNQTINNGSINFLNA